MNWKPGDRAIVKCHNHPEVNGIEVTVTSYPYVNEVTYEDTVTIEGPLIFTQAHTNVLHPIDGYDGNEATTWEKCVWQPKEFVRVR